MYILQQYNGIQNIFKKSIFFGAIKSQCKIIIVIFQLIQFKFLQMINYDTMMEDNIYIQDVFNEYGSYETYMFEQDEECYLKPFDTPEPKIKKKKRISKRFQYNYHKKKKRSVGKVLQVVDNEIQLVKPRYSACAFSFEEDSKILNQVLRLGPKFYKIAKLFPGKTVSMVKNRYYKYLRFRWEDILGSEYKCYSVPQDQTVTPTDQTSRESQ
ncbi:hypothetical protein pb186bvf_011108 [Paramecium bursaria]